MCVWVGTRMEGVKHLLEVMQTLLLEPSYDEVFGAKVFKIMRDDKGARLTYVKVTGGQLKTSYGTVR